MQLGRLSSPRQNKAILKVTVNLNLGVILIYSDPGSGTLLLQLAGLAASSILFYFRKFWFRLFSRKNRKPETQRPE